jgi:biotin carboxylase
MARDSDEFRDALDIAAASSRSGRVIVEAYMEGPEFSVDALVYKGTLTICGFADRHIFYPPYFIEMGHTRPSAYPKADIVALVQTFAQGVAALGLSHGAAKGDIKLTPQGPMIGEIAGRLSGGYMSGWTYPYASDCNLTAEAIHIASDESPAYLEARRLPFPQNAPSHGFTIFDLPTKRVCAERAWVSIPGQVHEVIGLEKAAKIPGVRDVLPRSQVGDAVVFPRNNVEKCGNIISVGDTREQAAAQALQGVKSIVLRLEVSNPATRRFLAGETSQNETGFPPAAFQAPPEVLQALQVPQALDIPADTPALSRLPECLKNHLDSLVDWNSRSLREALQDFDSLCPGHPLLPASRFWPACLRGSLQGMLFVADDIDDIDGKK